MPPDCRASSQPGGVGCVAGAPPAPYNVRREGQSSVASSNGEHTPLLPVVEVDDGQRIVHIWPAPAAAKMTADEADAAMEMRQKIRAEWEAKGYAVIEH